MLASKKLTNLLIFCSKAFVTKLSDGGSTDINMADGVDPLLEERDFVIQTGENASPNVKRIHSRPISEEPVVTKVGAKTPIDDKLSTGAIANDASSTSSGSSNEIFTFDVYAREGFDQIMKTVAGSSDAQEEMFARSMCDYLEIFENLSPGRYVFVE
jgi:hypothetical protein